MVTRVRTVAITAKSAVNSGRWSLTQHNTEQQGADQSNNDCVYARYAVLSRDGRIEADAHVNENALNDTAGVSAWHLKGDGSSVAHSTQHRPTGREPVRQ
jgi:hypothetical protein